MKYKLTDTEMIEGFSEYAQPMSSENMSNIKKRFSQKTLKEVKRSRIPISIRAVAAVVCCVMMLMTAAVAASGPNGALSWLYKTAVGEDMNSYLRKSSENVIAEVVDNGIKVEITAATRDNRNGIFFITITDLEGKGRITSDLAFDFGLGNATPSPNENYGCTAMERLDYDLSDNKMTFLYELEQNMEKGDDFRLTIKNMLTGTVHLEGLLLQDDEESFDIWQAYDMYPERSERVYDHATEIMLFPEKYPQDEYFLMLITPAYLSVGNAVLTENGISRGKIEDFLTKDRDEKEKWKNYWINGAMMDFGAGVITEMAMTKQGYRVVHEGGKDTKLKLYFTDGNGKTIKPSSVKKDGNRTVYMFNKIKNEEKLKKLMLTADIDRESKTVDGEWVIDFKLPCEKEQIVYEINRKYDTMFIETVTVTPFSVTVKGTGIYPTDEKGMIPEDGFPTALSRSQNLEEKFNSMGVTTGDYDFIASMVLDILKSDDTIKIEDVYQVRIGEHIIELK